MVVKLEQGAVVKFDGGEQMKLKPPCEVKDRGYWFCATHKKAIRNPNFDHHLEQNGKHEVCWMCWDHGAEQP